MTTKKILTNGLTMRNRPQRPKEPDCENSSQYWDDTVMASPPKGTIPAYGSSCSTGGVFLGKALGNAIKISDAVKVWEEMDVSREGLAQKPVKGKIHFYISNLNPPDIDITKSSFIANVSDISKFETIQDVIGLGSQDYFW
ncbi:uncharacterized protein LACBIDRAFT_322483 [Laccaria bicolor S238N-H82]|uniref:Predicted protein n=1 Tax=Laccaria bicolor (strain S238N-H82 / ATCC MYA-4686) TaxID=486041 RepID=B0CWG3_LACBS|nr:uncharacterized protein LACBIDRAFT_322483 [Laccaria bicolor S238N-H82]EDR13063.1 predicted protein [Laccaria bicolor S238N-H82]|eukprot:XP_001875561.1 predicted protein [Laccaria bicolor S238N-H82]